MNSILFIDTDLAYFIKTVNEWIEKAYAYNLKNISHFFSFVHIFKGGEGGLCCFSGQRVSPKVIHDIFWFPDKTLDSRLSIHLRNLSLHQIDANIYASRKNAFAYHKKPSPTILYSFHPLQIFTLSGWPSAILFFKQKMLLNIFDRKILEVYYRMFQISFWNNFRFYKNKFNRKTHDVLTQGMKLGGGLLILWDT